MNAFRDLTATLQSLRDVPGMAGSFVVSDLGRLLARDMPAVFGDDVLGEVGPRALRLRETMGHESDNVGYFAVSYAEYVLFLRPLRDGLLCALGTYDVNLASLRMAMTLTARRLNSLLDPRGASITSETSAVSRTQELTLDGTGTGTGPGTGSMRTPTGAQSGSTSSTAYGTGSGAANPGNGAAPARGTPVRVYRGTVVGGS
jgi:predicted regulator of Ras-like GTPase activity (Roadblock/LC7/MglB family)